MIINHYSITTTEYDGALFNVTYFIQADSQPFALCGVTDISSKEAFENIFRNRLPTDVVFNTSTLFNTTVALLPPSPHLPAIFTCTNIVHY